MLRFTIRDLLWLMVVVVVAVGFWLQLGAASRLRDERTLWKTRALQLESHLKLQTGATVEFLADKTRVTLGSKPNDQREKDPDH